MQTYSSKILLTVLMISLKYTNTLQFNHDSSDVLDSLDQTSLDFQKLGCTSHDWRIQTMVFYQELSIQFNTNHQTSEIHVVV